MHILVHAGFHKTGTTSTQNTLAANRDLLAPALRVMLKSDIAGMAEAARAYSRTGEDVEWALFLYETARIAETLDGTDPRPIVISSEDLSGHMPFRHRLPDYGAAPRLMAGIAETFAAACPGARIEFLFTTRAAEPWVRSCHAQHLRATRMCDSHDDFAARALPHADLDAMVDRIADAVAPLTVHRRALEDISVGPLGPLDALLDLVPLDPALRARIAPLPPANQRMPDDVLDALLALNRAQGDWDAIRDRKKQIMRHARRAAR